MSIVLPIEPDESRRKRTGKKSYRPVPLLARLYNIELWKILMSGDSVEMLLEPAASPTRLRLVKSRFEDNHSGNKKTRR